MHTQERLVDAADRLKLGTRERRILLTMPGLGFGFAPKDYDGIIERIDCSSCSKLMDFADEMEKPAELSPEDKERKATFERRRAWPVIGRFFREPKYASSLSTEDVIARIEAFKAACPAHWGTEEACAISEEMMGSYVHADRLVHSSGSL